MRSFSTIFLILLLNPLMLIAQQSEKDLILLQASFDGDISTVIQALKDSANINTTTDEGASPLIYAAQQGHEDLVRILVHNKANMEHKSNDSVNALLAASIFNHVAIVEFLSGKGSDVNTSDDRGISPLHYAAAYGYAEMFRMLQQKGANLDIADNEGNTPLMTAVYVGNAFMVDSFLKYGADINASDSKGISPLMIAVMKFYNDIAAFLLSKGADVNQTSNNGTSALSLAVDAENYAMMDMLLEKGAQVIPAEGKTTINPLLLAYKYEQYPVINHLRKKGVKLPSKPLIKNSFFMMNADLNHEDFMIGPSLGLFDKRYRIEGAIGFNTRIAAKRVFVKDDNGDEFQYWEGRQALYLSLKKHLPLSAKFSYPSLIIGIEEVYTWGDYKATDVKAKKGFFTVPVLAVQWKSVSYNSVSLGLKYFNYDPENVFPMRVFAAYTFYFDLINKTLDSNGQNASKNIKWLY